MLVNLAFHLVIGPKKGPLALKGIRLGQVSKELRIERILAKLKIVVVL